MSSRELWGLRIIIIIILFVITFIHILPGMITTDTDPLSKLFLFCPLSTQTSRIRKLLKLSFNVEAGM